MFLLFFQFAFVSSKLIINEPKELAEEFITRNSSISFSTANFGYYNSYSHFLGTYRGDIK